jgi:hypothetical protein
LQKLFSQFQTQSGPSGSVAQRGNVQSALSVKSRNHTPWIIDSGASDHMTYSHTLFNSYSPCAGNLKIRIADGTLSPIAGTGSVKISDHITLNPVLHVPNLSCNLLSISQLTKNSNCFAKFFPSHCQFQDLLSGKTIGSARESDGLYYFDNPGSVVVSQSFFSVNKNDPLLWHARLGHPNFMYLKKMYPNLFINKDISSIQCEICELAKHHRTSFPVVPYKPSHPFSLIHSDLWGPSRIPNRTNKKYFISFIDDHTRTCWVYLLKDKMEVREVFIQFYSMVNTQFSAKIQVLRTDNGTEYFNTMLSDFFSDKGIVHQSSCVDTPQQNGVAERKNRHLLDISRAIMFTSHVPKYLWGDAILTAAYLINRMPSRVLSFDTPLQKLLTYFSHTHGFKVV